MIVGRSNKYILINKVLPCNNNYVFEMTQQQKQNIVRRLFID
jgi:hypothetical protein